MDGIAWQSSPPPKYYVHFLLPEYAWYAAADYEVPVTSVPGMGSPPPYRVKYLPKYLPTYLLTCVPSYLRPTSFRLANSPVMVPSHSHPYLARLRALWKGNERRPFARLVPGRSAGGLALQLLLFAWSDLQSRPGIADYPTDQATFASPANRRSLVGPRSEYS